MVTAMSNPASRTRTAAQRALAEHANEIRTLNKRTIGDIIETGKHLIAAKKIVGHGGWLAWLDREFGWSDRTAQRYIEFAEAVDKSAKLADLNVPISGLYLLAAEDTPAEVIEAIAERCEQGERLSLAEVKKMIAEAEARDEEDDVEGGLATRMPISPSDVEHAYRSRYGDARQVRVHYAEPPPMKRTVCVPYYVPVDQPEPVSRTITYTSVEAEDPATLRIREAAKDVRWNFRALADALTEYQIGPIIAMWDDDDRERIRNGIEAVDRLKAALDRDNVVRFPDKPN
jgi:hypothetical protein